MSHEPPPDLLDRMTRIRELLPRLNAETNAAVAALESVEQFFLDVGLGLALDTRYVDPQRMHPPFYSLEYSRHGRLGRFCIKYVVRDHVEVLYRKPWSQTNREMKLRASHMLPSLIVAAENEIERIMRVADYNRTLSDAVRGLVAPAADEE